MAKDLEHFPIISSEIQRELYFLMALLLADERINEWTREKWSIAPLTKDVSHVTLPLKFITVAAAVRRVLDNIDSMNNTVGNDALPRYEGGVCGGHCENINATDEETGLPVEPVEADLLLRKACDYAIHADRTLFYPEGVPQSPGIFQGASFQGKITLYGRRHRKAWKAEIDFKKFVAACLVALEKEREMIESL